MLEPYETTAKYEVKNICFQDSVKIFLLFCYLQIRKIFNYLLGLFYTQLKFKIKLKLEPIYLQPTYSCNVESRKLWKNFFLCTL
jgi:hypothetical protein